MTTKIHHGFLARKYITECHGSACCVKQPNGNYVLITHDMEKINAALVYNIEAAWGEVEYMGAVCKEKYFLTKNLEEDPNIQAQKNKEWENGNGIK
jgi:hypothetical protein